MVRFFLFLASMLVLSACAAPMPNPFTLANTNWKLKDITQNGVVLPPLVGINITLSFSQDGKVSGESGCNTYGGDLETQGEIIKISSVFATKRACAEAGKMQLEAAYLNALQNAQLFEKRLDQLTITFANGGGKLVFVPN